MKSSYKRLWEDLEKWVEKEDIYNFRNRLIEIRKAMKNKPGNDEPVANQNK